MSVLPSRHVTRPVLTSAVLAALAAACSSGASNAAGPYDGAVDALCQARATDDPGVADVAFNAGAHALLHDLAKEVIDVDRGVAADLLTAKNLVEASLRDESEVAQLRPVLDDLLTEVRRSLSVLDLPAPAC